MSTDARVNLRLTDIAWAAGIFDGEGTGGLWPYKQRGGVITKPEMALSMTCEKTIRTFHEVVGVGTVYTLKLREEHHKPQWRWAVAYRGALAVAQLFFPYAVTKRDTLRAFLAHYGQDV